MQLPRCAPQRSSGDCGVAAAIEVCAAALQPTELLVPPDLRRGSMLSTVEVALLCHEILSRAPDASVRGYGIDLHCSRRKPAHDHTAWSQWEALCCRTPDCEPVRCRFFPAAGPAIQPTSVSLAVRHAQASAGGDGRGKQRVVAGAILLVDAAGLHTDSSRRDATPSCFEAADAVDVGGDGTWRPTSTCPSAPQWRWLRVLRGFLGCLSRICQLCKLFPARCCLLRRLHLSVPACCLPARKSWRPPWGGRDRMDVVPRSDEPPPTRDTAEPPWISARIAAWTFAGHFITLIGCGAPHATTTTAVANTDGFARDWAWLAAAEHDGGATPGVEDDGLHDTHVLYFVDPAAMKAATDAAGGGRGPRHVCSITLSRLEALRKALCGPSDGAEMIVVSSGAT